MTDFLCTHCVNGSFFRTVKSNEGIPYDTQYMCIDKTKKREMKIPSSIPSMLDYESGPGGWDGTTCPNFVEVNVSI